MPNDFRQQEPNILVKKLSESAIKLNIWKKNALEKHIPTW